MFVVIIMAAKEEVLLCEKAAKAVTSVGGCIQTCKCDTAGYI